MTRLNGRTTLVTIFLLSILAVAIAGNQRPVTPIPTPIPASTPALVTAPLYASELATTPAPTLQPSAPPVATIRVADKPQGIATGFAGGEEMVWVASLVTRSVLRLDPHSGQIMSAVPLDIAPLGLALQNGTLWITGGFNMLERLDTEAGRVMARITVGMNPRIPLASGNAVWVPNANDLTVSRIDPSTNQVSAVIPVGNPLDCPTSAEPIALAAGPDAVWATQCGAKSVARIDTNTNRVVNTIQLGVEPTGLQLVGDTLWVTSRAYDRLLRVDTHTGGIVASIALAGAGPVAGTSGAIWVESTGGQLARIDTRTNQVAETINVGAGPVAAPPSPAPAIPGIMTATGLGSLATGEASVWVSRPASGVVVRVDAGAVR